MQHCRGLSMWRDFSSLGQFYPWCQCRAFGLPQWLPLGKCTLTTPEGTDSCEDAPSTSRWFPYLKSLFLHPQWTQLGRSSANHSWAAWQFTLPLGSSSGLYQSYTWLCSQWTGSVQTPCPLPQMVVDSSAPPFLRVSRTNGLRSTLQNPFHSLDKDYTLCTAVQWVSKQQSFSSYKSLTLWFLGTNSPTHSLHGTQSRAC